MGEWMYRPTFSRPWLKLEVSPASRLDRFTAEEKADGNLWIGDWVGRTVGLGGNDR
jgi:hypothetical protein